MNSRWAHSSQPVLPTSAQEFPDCPAACCNSGVRRSLSEQIGGTTGSTRMCGSFEGMAYCWRSSDIAPRRTRRINHADAMPCSSDWLDCCAGAESLAGRAAHAVASPARARLRSVQHRSVGALRQGQPLPEAACASSRRADCFRHDVCLPRTHKKGRDP